MAALPTAGTAASVDRDCTGCTTPSAGRRAAGTRAWVSRHYLRRPGGPAGWASPATDSPARRAGRMTGAKLGNRQDSRTSYYLPTRLCTERGAAMADQAETGAPGRLRWQRRYDQARIRDADFTTLSGLEVDPVYGPPPG